MRAWLQAYLAYGQPVFAPCDGTVLTARDGLPDQVPGIIVPQPAGGNEIVIDSGREHIRLAHLRPGTVSVTEGQHVRAGLLLGEVGTAATPPSRICTSKPPVTGWASIAASQAIRAALARSRATRLGEKNRPGPSSASQNRLSPTTVTRGPAEPPEI